VEAHCNGEVLNYTKIANDAEIKKTKLYQYGDSLVDTLIVYRVRAWKETQKRGFGIPYE
jgi:predicted AAA+ superfamily ATPase